MSLTNMRERWYVVSTLRDYLARESLEREGIPTWLPERLVVKTYRGVVSRQTRPLIDGYLFASLVPGEAWEWINGLRGVNRMLTHHARADLEERPTPVRAGQVEGLRRRIAAMGGLWIDDPQEKPRRRFDKGERVRVSEGGGGMAGMFGAFVETRAGGMVELAIDGFGGTVPLIVQEALVEPA